MDNLIERLNEVVSSREYSGSEITTNWHRNPEGPEAAKIITSQSAEIARLTAYVADIARQHLPEEMEDPGGDYEGAYVIIVEKARTILATKGDAKP